MKKINYYPKCGSKHFMVNNEKSKKCDNCGFVYYMNACSATAAFILNKQGELLVARRGKEPAKGTLDLPGGFVDMNEPGEEAMAREVKEETGLDITSCQYLFSVPNIYHYSGIDIHTLDMFFRCTVEEGAELRANDDVEECMWVSLRDIHTEQFGLRSIRQALHLFLQKNG